MKNISSNTEERFELPGGCSVSDIEDFFEYIIKNMKEIMIILQ